MAELIQAKPPRYLVCVDGRSESQVALRLACAKAVARGGHVSLIHVMPKLDFQALHAVEDRMLSEQQTEAETLTRTLAESVEIVFGLRPDIQLRHGNIGDEIIAAATEDKDATMMVLGVAEHSSSRGQLTGWLATQLGTRLLIPLLLIPGNLSDQQVAALV